MDYMHRLETDNINYVDNDINIRKNNRTLINSRFQVSENNEGMNNEVPL